MTDVNGVAQRTFVSQFGMGEVVYLRVRPECMPGMIARISFAPDCCTYGITWGTGTETFHYAMELTREFEPDFTTS